MHSDTGHTTYIILVWWVPRDNFKHNKAYMCKLSEGTVTIFFLIRNLKYLKIFLSTEGGNIQESIVQGNKEQLYRVLYVNFLQQNQYHR